jgi:transposase InsO family protein
VAIRLSENYFVHELVAHIFVHDVLALNTYLKTTIAGRFFYLYMTLDVWSRKIMAATVFSKECGQNSALLFVEAFHRHKVDPKGLVLHSDNGGPMKGSTMLVTLQRLGVVPSFSRPGVSNDNPFSESLFRTLKYRPEYPARPFASEYEAQRWVDAFVHWYWGRSSIADTKLLRCS